MAKSVSTSGSEFEEVDCPICGPSPTNIWMDDGKPTRYLRCRSCGTVYASPRLSWAARYAWLDEAFGLGPGALANAAARRPALIQNARLIQNHVKRGRLLDIGCDTGEFFEEFEESRWERFGVEVSPSAADYAARTQKARVIAGTIQTAQLPGGFFDLATMIDMLYYVDDPRADLLEIARVLKPGGWLAIEVTGQAYQLLRSRGFVSLLLDRRWTRLHTDSSYLYWFSPTGLQRLLAECGFIPKTTYVIGSPVSSAWWRNLVSDVYRHAIRRLSLVSPRIFSWAPKYLIISQRRDVEI